MTIPASEGVFSWGPQTAKETLATTWYRHKMLDVNLGTSQAVQYFPPEVGGGFHPTGAFKGFAFGGGVGTLNPRLENVIGWLMYAGCGQLSNIAATPEAGITRHRFMPPDSYSDMKWLSLRKFVPGATGPSDDMGEVIQDVRLMSQQYTVGPASIVQAQYGFVGRIPKLDVTASGPVEWAYANAYETYESVPLGNKGGLKMPLGGAERKATGAVIAIANQYTTPQEELIIGSYYPDDFILQRQTFNAQWTFKWKDPTLYDWIVTNNGTPDGSGYVAWSPVVYTSDFELITESPANISGLSNPYRLRFYAQQMTWQSQGPPRLVGGGWLALPFVGTALEQPVIRNTFCMDLDNETANYAWP